VTAVVVLGWLLVQQGGVAVTAVVVGAVAVAGALLGAAVWVSGRLERMVSGQAREKRARAERVGAEDRAAGAGVVPAERALGAR
jgi:hypothetical protein